MAGKMTSVDSGIETSNESNDGSVVLEAKSQEVSTIRISPCVTHVNVVMTNLSSVNSSAPSCGIKQNVGEKNCIIFSESLDFGPHCSTVIHQFSLPAFTSSRKEENTLECLKHSSIQSARKKRRDLCPYRRFRELVDERALRTAASVNNEEKVEYLLGTGVDPNSCDHLLRTSLHLAACRGYSNIVRRLLAGGANPNQRDSLRNTPLHLAACTNHMEVVTLLLKAGADVESNDFYGRNPLQLAQAKLKFLQRRSNDDEDSVKVKDEIHKVIEMMLTFLHKKGQDTEAELLNAFQTRLTISQTKEEVECDVRDLLDSLNNLTLNKKAG